MRIILSYLITLAFITVASAAEPKAVLAAKHKVFLDKYCMDCHDADTEKGKVNLEDLPFEIETIEHAERWQHVLASLNAGEMPPEKKKQPTSDEKASFLADLSNTMVAARKVLSDSGGKIIIGRLNKREYKNTIKDLLGVSLSEDTLLSDDSTGDFDTVGAAMFFSGDKFEQYHKLGNQALEDFFERQKTLKVKPFIYRIEAEKALGSKLKQAVNKFEEENKRFQEFHKEVEKALQLPENKAFVAKLSDRQRNRMEDLYKQIGKLKGLPNPQKFGFRNLKAAGKTAQTIKDNYPYYKHYANLPFNDTGSYFQLNFGSTLIHIKPKQGLSVGKYKIRIRAGAVDGTTGYRHFIDLGHTPEKDIGRGQLLGYPLKTLHVKGSPAEPQLIETMVEIHSHSPRNLAIRERQSNWGELRKFYFYPLRNRNGYGHPAATWVDWVEIEGPIVQKDNSKLAAIFANHSDKSNDLERAKNIINDFALAAFRHKTPKPQFLDGLLDLFQNRLKKDKDFNIAIKAPLSVILASPRFLFKREPGLEGSPRELNELELAIRLAYFLWSSPPDENLIQLATDNQLKQNLTQQVERMLQDPKARHFVDGLTHQWLDMKRLDFFQFGVKEYRAFDQSARNASREEVYQTVLHLLRSEKEGQLSKLLKSDFVVINAILADIYGIENVKGDEFRRVQVAENSPRGGLLGMVAINAMGSDGVESSPVERGAWVLRHLLNNPPPPAPANVPQLSRIEGKKTKREILVAHQQEPQCASCHRKIDPIGFGLENFDAIGRWRKTDKHVVSKNNRKGIIDSSGAFYNGPEFANFLEMRDHIVDKKDDFARGFTEALIEYSLGRPFAFTDEDLANDILKTAKAKNYRMSEFIHALVQTKEFQSK